MANGIDMTKLAQKAAAQREAQNASSKAPAGDTTVIGRNGKPVPQFYANIGVCIDLPDEDGVVEPTFFSSNIGAPVDFVEKLNASENSSDEWKLAVAMQHAFAERVEAAKAALEPGETVMLEVPLTVAIQLRRTNPNKATPQATEVNPAIAEALAAMKV